MTTHARTRAETLFASITTRANDAIEPSALPLEYAVKARTAGPNTLHLPSGTDAARIGWSVAKPHRTHKSADVGKTW